MEKINGVGWIKSNIHFACCSAPSTVDPTSELGCLIAPYIVKCTTTTHVQMSSAPKPDPSETCVVDLLLEDAVVSIVAGVGSNPDPRMATNVVDDGEGDDDDAGAAASGAAVDGNADAVDISDDNLLADDVDNVIDPSVPARFDAAVYVKSLTSLTQVNFLIAVIDETRCFERAQGNLNRARDVLKAMYLSSNAANRPPHYTPANLARVMAPRQRARGGKPTTQEGRITTGTAKHLKFNLSGLVLVRSFTNRCCKAVGQYVIKSDCIFMFFKSLTPPPFFVFLPSVLPSGFVLFLCVYF